MAAPQRLLPCITLIGMAAAGKSTVSREMARLTGWACMDTDHLLEAAYAVPLQRVADAFDKAAFIEAEAQMICSIRAHRVVIATGGSVVYSEPAMRHLVSLGHIVYLDVPLSVIERRIAAKPNRGLAMSPGQTLADLYAERAPLYRRWTSVHCDVGRKNPEQCARWILKRIKLDQGY
jgi:shikimate kinase